MNWLQIAARARNRLADLLFMAGDRLIRLAYRLDPGPDRCPIARSGNHEDKRRMTNWSGPSPA
jgi:hypothetical protein